MTLVAITAVFSLAIIISCDETIEDYDNNNTIVSDKKLGESCEFNCDDIWCSMINFADCVSHTCIGQPGHLYCTQFCLTKTDCPDGYTCTELCDLKSSDYYCVTNADYEHLVEIELCE